MSTICSKNLQRRGTCFLNHTVYFLSPVLKKVWCEYEYEFLPISTNENQVFQKSSILIGGNGKELILILTPHLFKDRAQVNSKDITFQQDGAPPHWRTEVLDWLSSKFGDNIISYKTARSWPSSHP